MSLKEETSVVKQNNTVNSLGISTNPIVNKTLSATGSNTKEGSKQYSGSIFYSMATEHDMEIEDELEQGTDQVIYTPSISNLIFASSKDFMRVKDRYLDTVKKQLFIRKRRKDIGFSNSFTDSE